MIIKCQILSKAAIIPEKRSSGAAGFDLFSAEPVWIPPGERKLVRTNIALEIPRGFEGQIRPRSGLAFTHGVTVLNTPGTIDCDYRGDVGVLLINHGSAGFQVSPGDRIAQLVFKNVNMDIKLFDAAEIKIPLSCTDRGSGGFGSTGQ
jgi:dUTP pyrophosphatase